MFDPDKPPPERVDYNAIAPSPVGRGQPADEAIYTPRLLITPAHIVARISPSMSVHRIQPARPSLTPSQARRPFCHLGYHPSSFQVHLTYLSNSASARGAFLTTQPPTSVPRPIAGASSKKNPTQARSIITLKFDMKMAFPLMMDVLEWFLDHEAGDAIAESADLPRTTHEIYLD
ncbi:unnamed protein product, partial [Mesorhabditis spiculigera]